MQERRNQISLRQKGEYRIMCLGESTTKDQYPPYLEEILNQSNLGIKFSVIDKGINRSTTSMILSKLDSDLDIYRPDMVISMMGINSREEGLPSEFVSDSRVFKFLNSMRTYHFVRLLWLHMIKRFKGLRFQDVVSARLLFQWIASPPAFAEYNEESDSRDDKAYFELGKLYRNQGKFSEAEASLKKAIELKPRDGGAYIELGWVYRDQGRHSEAEELFKAAIKLNPEDDALYVQLGSFYQERGRFSEAEQSYKKATELNPENDEGYSLLGYAYHDLGRYAEAEEAYKKAIEINPGNIGTYIRWVYTCFTQGKFSEAEEACKKAIEIAPDNYGVYVELGLCYREHGKFSEAEEALKKAIEINPKNDKAYGVLEILYLEMGKAKLARKFAKKAEGLRLSYYPPITAANYQKLKSILDKRGITYVCAQYPMRSLEPLKKLFQGNDKGVIFVDNEKVFKDEVAKHGRQEYFKDMFGREFGHCTDKGNRLLAQNIANVILREVFGK